MSLTVRDIREAGIRERWAIRRLDRALRKNAESWKGAAMSDIETTHVDITTDNDEGTVHEVSDTVKEPDGTTHEQTSTTTEPDEDDDAA